MNYLILVATVLVKDWCYVDILDITKIKSILKILIKLKNSNVPILISTTVIHCVCVWNGSAPL